MGKFGLIIFFVLLPFLHVCGQKTATDSVPASQEKVHSPKKASIYSAILPGLGQAYNKKYWKIPIIYAGFGAFIYFVEWNNDQYVLFKNAYKDLSITEGFDKETYLKKYSQIPNLAAYNLDNSGERSSLLQKLNQVQESYRRDRDLLKICTVAFYLLNIMDASVDAHFFNFDISDNLSFNWKPSTIRIENQKYLCLNCNIKF